MLSSSGLRRNAVIVLLCGTANAWHWRDAVELFSSTTPQIECNSSSIPTPELFGAQVLGISAAEIRDYSANLGQQDDHFATTVSDLNFCNVTITYTHVNQEDEVIAELWLPLKGWNGRFMGTGGGGWLAGRGDFGTQSLAYAVSKGYAAVSTDAGHTTDPVGDASNWLLKSPGNIDWSLLQNFAHIAYNDAAILGKAVTESFYGRKPRYSYWTGCSTGGRQGLMMAQRYPGVYDGVLAAAPAINWAKFVVAEYWPQLIMKELGYYPPPCEFAVITAAAIAACDELDGIKDNIISAPGLCKFTGDELVGQPFTCNLNGVLSDMKVTAAAVKIAQAAWTGPKTTSGAATWYGLTHNAPLDGVVMTICESDPSSCKPMPFPIPTTWIKSVVQRDPGFDLSTLTRKSYNEIMRLSENQFRSVISSDDADLSGLKSAGGKVILWHGGSDKLIPLNGSVDYYQRVLEHDQKAADYFRFFEAPGVDHCGDGNGYFPSGAIDRLVSWVERGKAPDTLIGTTLPDAEGNTKQAPLCAYPKVAVYDGGNAASASSYQCKDSFTVNHGHTEV